MPRSQIKPALLPNSQQHQPPQATSLDQQQAREPVPGNLDGLLLLRPHAATTPALEGEQVQASLER
jgi:hypothetical protein